MVSAFAIAVLIGFIAPSGKALAVGEWRRQHGSTCFMQNSLNAAFYSENSGLLNNTGTMQVAICPYIDDSYLPRANVWTLNVHGQKNTPSGTDKGQACVKRWSTFSNDCGIPTTITANTVWTMGLFADYWRSQPADFAYIRLELQPGSGVFGFFVGT